MSDAENVCPLSREVGRGISSYLAEKMCACTRVHCAWMETKSKCICFFPLKIAKGLNFAAFKSLSIIQIRFTRAKCPIPPTSALIQQVDLGRIIYI